MMTTQAQAMVILAALLGGGLLFFSDRERAGIEAVRTQDCVAFDYMALRHRVVACHREVADAGS